ncbi:MAG: hypothetical protein JST19_20400, partial [Bacteroidetes bacterium]|nr:hypothetical protein [Bacteroidota bacterium]
MILNNSRHAFTNDARSVRITDGKISRVQAVPFMDTDEHFLLDLKGAVLFPGLINSH